MSPQLQALSSDWACFISVHQSGHGHKIDKPVRFVANQLWVVMKFVPNA
jgi:hypothetical protein